MDDREKDLEGQIDTKPKGAIARLKDWIDGLDTLVKVVTLGGTIASFVLILVVAPWTTLLSYILGSHYNVGQMSEPPKYSGFRPGVFESSLWSDRLQSEEALFNLIGETLVIGDGYVVGRAGPSTAAKFRLRVNEGTCLRVTDVSFRPYLRDQRGRSGAGIATPLDASVDAFWALPVSQMREEARRRNKSVRALFLDSLPKDLKPIADSCNGNEYVPGRKACPRIAVWVKAHRAFC